MSRALVVLDTAADRQKVIAWANKAPWGTRVEWKAPKRTLDQNSRMWAMLTEVATQVPWHGIKLTPDDWKLIFMDALKRELRMVPNIEGNGFVSLGRSSSDMSKDEMTDLIELIFSFGAKHDVKFQEPSGGPPPSPDEQGSGAVVAPSRSAAGNSYRTAKDGRR